MSEMQTVSVSKQGHVATILLNRPESLNAFNRAMRKELYQALTQLAEDAEVRCVVLGTEGRAFSSGADLSEGPAEGQTVEAQLMDEYWPILKLMAEMDQTVIAANPGIMAGIGCAFVMNSDLAVMAEEGSMVMAFSNIGLVPDGGAVWSLLNALGYQRAFQLIAEGGRMDAQTCLASGVVSKLAPADQVLAEAQAWAQALAQRPPIALRETKRLLRNAAVQSYGETVAAEAKTQDLCFATEDSREAIKAFQEKRKPVFVGR
jgi:2-(1,2-epoxy-1,2-dihydrophenyl)acetyl-CoA isomerase